MSVIHEALKKAGQPIIAQPDRKKSGVPLRPEVEFHRKRAAVNWGPLFILAVLALITGPILLPLFHTASQKTTVQDTARAPRSVSVGEEVSSGASSARQSPNQLAQFAIEEVPAIQPTAPSWTGFTLKSNPLPQFLLTGVVFSENSAYCLINKKILKVGEQVGGATLTSISANEVTLDYLGEKIVVPVTR